MSDQMRLFGDVVGHQRVLELLAREVAAPANAYLFVGAAGVGKATVARRFSALLLCPEAGGHTGECRSCRRVMSAAHPDLIEPDARQGLGVDQARSTIHQASLSPVEAARKVFLFDDAGTMTDQAANALLKTLEEPTATSVFVLVAEFEEQLPTTVASRCRTIHFGRVGEPMLVSALVERGVEEAQARVVAGLAGGRPGLAFSLLHSDAASAFRQQWLAVPSRASSRPGESFRLAAEMLATVEPLLEDAGEELPKDERMRRRGRLALLSAGLELVASWYLDAAAVQLGGPIRNKDVPLAMLTSVTPGDAVTRAERTLDAAVDLEANLRPQLLLADLFADLALD
ncbi:MAG: DNA polymerase III subunit [Acidimicrobiia bacterium]|nr:DNA polymerase III subunit [Acidimicrobiia bacterium]